MDQSKDIPAGGSPSVDVVRVDLETYFAFLRDIGAELRDPMLSRMAGYAYGYARAMLEKDDVAAAARQLDWLVTESARFADAVGYPGAPRSR
ncbi:hypothetical protein [Streptomyces tendae]|uniref:hypothetical protein n=1 Tax=Streptomyces tendae TaxID=1932 RepID=UPI003EB75B4B